jgi:hypothetical protein
MNDLLIDYSFNLAAQVQSLTNLSSTKQFCPALCNIALGPWSGAMLHNAEPQKFVIQIL